MIDRTEPRYYGSSMMAVMMLLTWIVGMAASAGPPVGELAIFAKSRQWSDAAGKFKIEATLDFASDTEVKLKKPDGRIVTVPLNKLSSDDRAFVKVFLEAEAKMGGSGSENPFEGGEVDSAIPSGSAPSGSSPGSTAPATKPLAFSSIPMAKFSDSRTKPIAIDFAQPFWNAKPITALKIPAQEDQIIKLPVEKDFWEKAQLKVAGGTPTAFVNIYRQGHNANENYSKLGSLQFPDGDPKALGQGNVSWKLLALTPDAKRAAFVHDKGWDKGNDVAIVTIENGAATPEFQFVAGVDWDEVVWGSFLSNDRFLTISAKLTMTLWDLQGKKMIARGPAGDSHHAVIGGRSELIAVTNQGNVALLNGDDLKQVATLKVDRPGRPRVAFSTNGERLAVYVPFNVLIYDLKNGELIKSIAVSQSQEALPLDWIGEHLLIDHSLLVDVERGLPLWSYTAHASGKVVWGSQLYLLFADKQSSVVSVRLPTSAAEREAGKMHRESMLAVKKGSTLSLTSDLQGLTSDQQREAQTAVANNLTSLGYKVATGTNIQVHLALKQGEMQTTEYGESNSPFPIPFSPFRQFDGPTTKVSYRPWIHTILVTGNGQELYKSEQQVSSPGSVQLKSGESIQQAVDRHVRPNVKFFESVYLPSEILKPQYRNGLGKSEISAAGVK